MKSNTALETLDFSSIKLEKKPKADYAARIWSQEEAEAVDHVADLHQAYVSAHEAFTAAVDDLRDLGVAHIVEEVALGNPVLNLTYTGDYNFAEISVKANCRNASVSLLEGLREHLGAAADSFLKPDTKLRMKNAKGLVAAVKRIQKAAAAADPRQKLALPELFQAIADLDLERYAESTEVTKPRPRWPELLAAAALRPAAVRGVFKLLLNPGSADDGQALIYSPSISINPDRTDNGSDKRRAR